MRLLQFRVAVPYGMGARARDGCCWAVIVGFLHRQQSDRIKRHARAAWGEAFNQGFSLLHSVETLHSVDLFTGIRWLSGSIVTGDVYG